MPDTVSRRSISSFDCIMICSVIALSIPKKIIKRLVYKYDLAPKQKQFDYWYGFYLLHHHAHQVDAQITIALDSCLNKLHSQYIEQLENIESSDVRSLKSYIDKGLAESPGGVLWALLSEPRAELQSQGVYYAHKLVYQLFHQTMGSKMHSDDEIDSDTSPELHNSIRKENAALRKEVRKITGKIKKADKQIEHLESENNRLTEKIFELKSRPSREGRLLRENRKLLYRLSTLENSNEVKISKMYPETCEQVSECIFNEEKQSETPVHCDHIESCPLNTLKVAVVGGLDRLETRYRTIVEQLGGEFLFHNGQCRSGTHMLRNIVCGSDIVVFITSVNSHNAMCAVKAECKKTGKKFTVLKQTSPEALGKKLLAEAVGY